VGKSPCDWAYHIMLHSEPPPEFCSQLAEAIQTGYPTLKIFTTNILPSPHGRYAVWIRGRPNPKVPVLRIKPRKLIARDHVHDRAQEPAIKAAGGFYSASISFSTSSSVRCSLVRTSTPMQLSSRLLRFALPEALVSVPTPRRCKGSELP
jgi:hypothetical protein